MSDPAEAEDLDLDRLVREAERAREGAYAPYSNFLVGAAVRSDAGTFTGANVENASYSVAICGERVAGAAAVAAGARRIDAIALASSAGTPTPPCGVCRQFLSEFGLDMVVVSKGTNRERSQWRLSELLPHAFGPADLEEA